MQLSLILLFDFGKSYLTLSVSLLYLTVSTAITCSSLPSVSGQIIYSPDSSNPFDYGTLAEYSCDTGLGVNGPITRTCGGDGLNTTGVWSDSARPTTCDGRGLFTNVIDTT